MRRVWYVFALILLSNCAHFKVQLDDEITEVIGQKGVLRIHHMNALKCNNFHSSKSCQEALMPGLKSLAQKRCEKKDPHIFSCIVMGRNLECLTDCNQKSTSEDKLVLRNPKENIKSTVFRRFHTDGRKHNILLILSTSTECLEWDNEACARKKAPLLSQKVMAKICDQTPPKSKECEFQSLALGEGIECSFECSETLSKR